MADNLKPAQLQPFTLAGSGTAIGATTIVLKSFKSIPDVNGTQTSLTINDFGTQGFGTLEPGSLGQEEQFVFTGVTQNGDGTATLTGVKPVLFLSPYTQGGAGLTKSHAGGVIMVITNSSGYYDTFANKNNNETITQQWIFPSAEADRPNLNADVDAIANTALITHGELARATFAGTVNASTVQKGIVELSTTAEFPAGTSVGGTGAFLVPANSYFNSTPTASTAPVSDANALISQGWVDQLFTAGEAIDTTVVGANKPLAVYIKESDGKVYKTNTTTITDQAAWNFIGFAVFNQNVAINGSVKVRLYGIVPNFSGLTIGNYYYLTTTAGAVTNSSGTLQVGKAISATQLYIEVGRKSYKLTQTFNSTTNVAVSVGFRPERINIYACGGGSVASSGGWNELSANPNSCIFFGTVLYGPYSTADAWYSNNGGGNFHRGNVNTITSTGFTLSNTKTGTPNDVGLVIEVFGN